MRAVPALLCLFGVLWLGAEEATAAEADREPQSGEREAEETREALTDEILEALSAHEPIYFIVGGGSGDVTAKFQLSARYRLFRPVLPAQRPAGLRGSISRFLDGVQLGYTQSSVWDLSSTSAPFRDTSFKPSLFYFHRDLIEPSGVLRQLGFQSGLEHESNGKSGLDSRSINIIFWRPIFTLGDAGEYHWTVSPKVYAYLEKEDNPDIAHYRGYFDLILKFGRLDGLELTATLRKGTRSRYGSAQLDASYPIARLWRRLNALLQVQYFTGYGETILDYDRFAGHQIRAGLMIVPYGVLLP